MRWHVIPFAGATLLKFLSPTVIPGIVVGYTLFQYIVIKLGLPSSRIINGAF